MHKIDGAGHLNNSFVNEDLLNPRAPTQITPEWLNAVQNEIANVITTSGLVLNKADNTQLTQAIAEMISDFPDASTSIKGKVQLATDAQAQSFAGGAAITASSLNAAFKGANQSLTASGYQKLPGGLILQWVRTLIANTTVATYAYPIAFPNGALCVFVTDTGTTLLQGFAAETLNNAQFQAISGVNNSQFGIIAIGF